jgi:hypothetical protein
LKLHEVIQIIDWDEQAARIGDPAFRAVGHAVRHSIMFDINNIVRRLCELGDGGRGLEMQEIPNPRPPAILTWMETSGVLQISMPIGGELQDIRSIGCLLARTKEPDTAGLFPVRADLFLMTDRDIATYGTVRYKMPAAGGVPTNYEVSFPINVDDGRGEPAAIELMYYFGPFFLALSLLNRPDSSTRRLPSAPGSPPMNEIVFDPRLIGQRKEGN